MNTTTRSHMKKFDLTKQTTEILQSTSNKFKDYNSTVKVLTETGSKMSSWYSSNVMILPIKTNQEIIFDV
jgi:K+-sensing histidine kinase KdpD